MTLTKIHPMATGTMVLYDACRTYILTVYNKSLIIVLDGWMMRITRCGGGKIFDNFST